MKKFKKNKNKTLIIAEIGPNHNGSVKKAAKMVKEIDYILDNSTIFDDLEPYIPEKIWQVFVITILNGFQSNDWPKSLPGNKATPVLLRMSLHIAEDDENLALVNSGNK